MQKPYISSVTKKNTKENKLSTVKSYLFRRFSSLVPIKLRYTLSLKQSGRKVLFFSAWCLLWSLWKGGYGCILAALLLYAALCILQLFYMLFLQYLIAVSFFPVRSAVQYACTLFIDSTEFFICYFYPITCLSLFSRLCCSVSISIQILHILICCSFLITDCFFSVCLCCSASSKIPENVSNAIFIRTLPFRF